MNVQSGFRNLSCRISEAMPNLLYDCSSLSLSNCTVTGCWNTACACYIVLPERPRVLENSGISKSST